MSKFLHAAGMAATLLTICVQTCLGADSSDWANLSRIQAGEKVQVVRQKMKTVSGRFESFSQDSIVVRQKTTDVVVPRNDVVRVTIAGRSHRLRNAALGAVAGGGAGLLLGHLGTQRWNGGREGVFIASALVGAGGGAALGVAIPGYPTVYRAAAPVKTAN